MKTEARDARLRIYFVGVGGQGTLTATNLLARAALDVGLEAVGGEVHGMAQRGGVVESALLLGGWRSPRVDKGEADVLLGFEPLETLRALPYLRTGGVIFSSSDPLAPLSVALGQASYPALDDVRREAANVARQIWFLPCRSLGREAGSVQSGGTALLGAACASGLLPISFADLVAAIERHLPASVQQVNLKAAELGRAALE